MFRTMAVVATVMILLAVFMMVYGGLGGNLQVQIGGLTMYTIALPMLFQFPLSKIENRLRDIEERLESETGGS